MFNDKSSRRLRLFPFLKTHLEVIGVNDVTFEIVAFSTPAVLVARLAGPISPAIERHATMQYLEGIRAYVTWAS